MIESKNAAKETRAMAAQRGLESLQRLGRNDLVQNFERLLSQARTQGILQEVLSDYAGLIKDAVVEEEDKRINRK